MERAQEVTKVHLAAFGMGCKCRTLKLLKGEAGEVGPNFGGHLFCEKHNTGSHMPKCRTQNEARRDRNAMGLNILYVDQVEDCKHAPPIRGCLFPPGL